MTNPADRFIVVEQLKPQFYATDLTEILPLKWEVIDRGPNFILWDSSSVQEQVIARFAHSVGADQLLRILRRQE